jgi:tRNA-specific 2-thiouridylase
MVGMSGGVDSSLAAALLVEQGHEVVGAFMKNWSDEKDPVTGECAWKEERRDAMRVAARLGIPFETLDFEAAYRERVVGYMLREYAAGRTPNPDVLCNREIKFDLFLAAARERGFDAVATGHYARVDRAEDGRFRLLAGLDGGKDQSYFVHALGQRELPHVLFPIGHLEKSEVRGMARARGLETADKKDSQGLCFVGKVELGEFLARGLAPKPGRVVSVEGEDLGAHPDVHRYTIGQRQGLAIGGGPALFVVAKDVSAATVTVARGEDHPALFRAELEAGEASWVSGIAPTAPFRCEARIRYRQPLQACEVVPAGDRLRVRFDAPQRAVAPGQFIVLYDGDEVLGGATIL